MDSNFDNSLSKISTLSESAYAPGMNQGVQAQHAGAISLTRTGTAQNSPESQPDQVTISEDALRKAGLLKDDPQTGKTGAPAKTENTTTNNDRDALALENLKRGDHEVRAHEQAHVTAGGALIRGAASFGYATGPDGKLYAVSGEVSIDSSPVQDDPTATILKMIKVTKAALAPAQPSGQDRSVASAAIQTETEARQAVTRQQLEKTKTSPTPPGQTIPSGAPEIQKSDSGTHSASTSLDAASPADIPQQTTFQSKHINIQA